MRLGLALGLAGCAGASTGEPSSATTAAAAGAASMSPGATEIESPPAHEQGAILMAVRGVAMPAKRQSRRPLQIDDRLQSGDFFAYYVRVDRDAYVYVLQFYADGSAAVLFPASGAMKVIAGAEQRLPADERGWFRLDEAPGTEHLYVIATEAPLEESDPTLARLIGQVRASPRAEAGAEPASEEPRSEEPSAVPAPATSATVAAAPSAPPRATKLARLSDPLLRHARERAAVVVRVEDDGMVEYQGRARDGLGVVYFPFHHDPAGHD